MKLIFLIATIFFYFFNIISLKKAFKKKIKRTKVKKNKKAREDYPSCKNNFPRICKHDHRN